MDKYIKNNKDKELGHKPKRCWSKETKRGKYLNKCMDIEFRRIVRG